MTKLTKQQRQRLLDTYRTYGKDASAALCLELGVEPKYGQKLASRAGDVPKYRPDRPVRQRAPKGTLSDREDPRWKWAIERGAVTA